MPTIDVMLGRLLIGIVKGLLIGTLLGVGLAQIGAAVLSAWYIAYPAAALAGVLVGLVAGKPIWAKDARIEAGMKAVVGAILASVMMFAAQRWLTMGVPALLSGIPGGLVDASGTLGTLAVTSLALIAALLGGFYEADNDAPPEESAKSLPASEKGRLEKSRVKVDLVDDELDEDLGDETDKKRAKK